MREQTITDMLDPHRLQQCVCAAIDATSFAELRRAVIDFMVHIRDAHDFAVNADDWAEAERILREFHEEEDDDEDH